MPPPDSNLSDVGPGHLIIDWPGVVLLVAILGTGIGLIVWMFPLESCYRIRREMKTNVRRAVLAGFSLAILILIFCAHRFIEGMSFHESLKGTLNGALGMLVAGLILFWIFRRKPNENTTQIPVRMLSRFTAVCALLPRW